MISRLEGNPYINWKFLNIPFNGKIYRVQVRAFDCNLNENGIAYYIKYKNKQYAIVKIDETWHKLNNPNEFATSAGNEIEDVIYRIKRANLLAGKEKKDKKVDSDAGWGKGLNDLLK
jgi:hypothetical protein